MPTIGELLAAARQQLRAAPFAPPPREAGLLLRHVLGLGEAQLLARSAEPVAASAATRFAALVEARLGGEPVAYLLGEREFYGRAFAVDRRVLIPRPETEHLVAAALALPLPPRPLVLDVGAGSGAIAVTLALEIATARIVASDLSPAALAVTRGNARRHGVEARVLPVAMDLASALRVASFDLVVSNPPYVAPEAAASLSPEVRDFEPHLALFAADAGRAVLTRLLDLAVRELRPGVYLLLEIGYDQATWLAAAVTSRRELELVELVADYGGVPRTAVVRRRI